MLCWTVHLEGGPEGDCGAAVTVGNKVYSFGGYELKHRDQIGVQVFNTVSLHWTKLPPVAGGRESHPEVPSTCEGHTAVLIEHTVYIWGGVKYHYPGAYCDLLYVFDVDTHRWFESRVSGAVPEARYHHSACVLGNVMYVYGGYNKLSVCTNDIYKLDSATTVWSLINTRGTPPPASSCHSATIIGTKMLVFGGHFENNNVKVLDTETNCWLSAPFTQLPERRWVHSAFAYGGELYIFGGNPETFRFNPETFSWKKVEPTGEGLRPYCRMCCCMVGDRIILFKGYKGSCVYVLDFCPSMKTLCKLAVIRYGLDIRWELAAMSRLPTATGKKVRKKRIQSRKCAPRSQYCS